MSGDLPPLQRLLLAYSRPQEKAWNELIWLIDQRLAAVVRGVNEPMIALIRMAWWEEALADDDRSKGNGEPLVERWRASPQAQAAGPHVARLIEGWRCLIADESGADLDLERYAAERGGGLFALLGENAPSGGSYGPVWALWDLAGHVRDEALAQRCIAHAGERLAALPVKGKSRVRPLKLITAIALSDVKTGRVPAGFSPRHYLRLLRAAYFA